MRVFDSKMRINHNLLTVRGYLKPKNQFQVGEIDEAVSSTHSLKNPRSPIRPQNRKTPNKTNFKLPIQKEKISNNL